jgi:hypothetical protein
MAALADFVPDCLLVAVDLGDPPPPQSTGNRLVQVIGEGCVDPFLGGKEPFHHDIFGKSRFPENFFQCGGVIHGRFILPGRISNVKYKNFEKTSTDPEFPLILVKDNKTI